MAQERAIFTPLEVGELLGLSKSEAYILMNDTDFPSFKLKGRWKVAKTDFWKWLDERKGSRCNQPPKANKSPRRAQA